MTQLNIDTTSYYIDQLTTIYGVTPTDGSATVGVSEFAQAIATINTTVTNAVLNQPCEEACRVPLNFSTVTGDPVCNSLSTPDPVSAIASSLIVDLTCRSTATMPGQLIEINCNNATSTT